jgi:hypothetical protein
LIKFKRSRLKLIIIHVNSAIPSLVVNTKKAVNIVYKAFLENIHACIKRDTKSSSKIEKGKL